MPTRRSSRKKRSRNNDDDDDHPTELGSSVQQNNDNHSEASGAMGPSISGKATEEPPESAVYESEEAPAKVTRQSERAVAVESGNGRKRKAEKAHNSNKAQQNNAEDGTNEEQQASSKQLHITIQRDDRSFERDFTKLDLNPFTVKALQQTFGFSELTEVQARCLSPALAGKDILAEAKTGSGKTLGFLIPAVQLLSLSRWRPENGTFAIVIAPTRELAKQIEGVLMKLLTHHNGAVTCLCCIGGEGRKAEGFKLASGQQIAILTPGRLLDHLRYTEDWVTRNLKMLIIDEADRVLDNGFEQDVREIVKLLPSRRQTFLFSATQTTRVEQLARVSFQQRNPVFVSCKKQDDKATVDSLEQGYVVCPSEFRLLLLYHFLRKNVSKKVIVFFSSRNAVSYHSELFNFIDLPCVGFHGKQKQQQRNTIYMQFCNAPSGILLTTDVAARGLDIPKVDWIIQFDPPDEPTKYIHRVGRTARAGKCGNALMFLLPSELLFLSYLKEDANVAVSEFEFDTAKLDAGGLRKKLADLVTSNYYLRNSAKEAYEGYLLSYSASQLKNVFDVQKLDLAVVAKGFALTEPPPIKLDLSQSAAHMGRKKRQEAKKSRERQTRHQQQKGGGGGGGGNNHSWQHDE